MNHEEQVEARVEFIYHAMLRENPSVKANKENTENEIRKLLEHSSVVELLHQIVMPYTPAPLFDDSITTIRIPSGKVVFAGLDWKMYHDVTEQEKVWSDFASGRDQLCHIFAEKHNLAWTTADSDGTTHLIHNNETNMLSIVDWSILTEEEVLADHETVLGRVNCEGFVYLVDHDQYFESKKSNDDEGEIVVHDVEPGIYEYVAMSLKDDKYFTPGLFETKRDDYATLEWVSPL